MYSSFGSNVFYFMSAPMMRLSLAIEPFDPANHRVTAANPPSSFSAMRSSSIAPTAQSSLAASSPPCRCPRSAILPPGEKSMNARNRILILMGILLIVSLCWYLLSTNRRSDLQLIGTVDANEVVVSSRIPGRIQKLTVDEGDTVSCRRADRHHPERRPRRRPQRRPGRPLSASASSCRRLRTPQRQTQGSTSSQVANAKRNCRLRRPPSCRRRPSTSISRPTATRTIALAKQGVMSQQASEEAATSLAPRRPP